ncbi:MAG: stage II sporulation protein M [Firmicutes bacterium]|nr:stage II sporulation protein M [Bacillota bacterium]
MKKIFKLINAEFKKNKKLYVFISILLVIGFLAGTLFITILSSQDKKLIEETISNFFLQIKNNNIDLIYTFRTSLTTNLVYVLLMFFLGISIIGIPIIVFLIFIKSFVLGFSIVSIIFKYKLGGTLLSLGYIFPHQILNLIIISFIGLYALKVSITLIKLIFSKKQVNFKLIIKKYFVVLILCVILSLISSTLETFLCTNIIKLFSFLIK